MSQGNRPLVWMEGEIKTPPFSGEARVEAGMLLRRLQRGENIGLPHSRPMPDIGSRCHELRIRDETKNWRIFYITRPMPWSSSRCTTKRHRRLPKPSSITANVAKIYE